MAKNKKKYVTEQYGKPVFLPSKKKQYVAIMSTSLAIFILLVLVPFISEPDLQWLPLLGIVPIFFSMYAVSGIIGEKDGRERYLVNPLENFAQYQISSSDTKDIPRRRRTVINTVMKCDHEDSSTTDKKGNCQVCKEGFTLAVTPELREHLDEALSEAVERAESKNRKKLYRAKERELNLNNSQSQHLASLFEDNDKIASLKKSKHTIAALKEITADDVQSTVDKENGVNTIK